MDRFVWRIGRRQDRQSRALRGADQNRLLRRCPRGEVGEHLVVARFVFRPERDLAGREALEVGLDVKAHDEESVGREDFRTCRAKMNPAPIAARDDHRRATARAVQIERLRVTTNGDRLPRLTVRSSGES